MGSTDTSAAKTCEVCGKEFIVIHQDIYTYRRGSKWFCRYNCMRAYDKEMEAKKMRKVTLEDKKKAVEMALRGDDPIEFLGTLCDDPKQMWWRIKTNLKKKDPEAFAKIDSTKEPQTAEEAIEAAGEAAETFFGQCQEMGLRVETPEAPKICKPLTYDGFEVQKVKGQFATYDLGLKCSDGTQILVMDTGLEEIGFDVKDWPKVIQELKNAGLVLGVEL